MKLLFVSAVMAVFFTTTPGAVASPSTGVDSEPEPSSSFDEYPQDSTFSADEMMMMDSEDEPVNNMFAALAKANKQNCDGIEFNTCDRRKACVWKCRTRHFSDRDRGCCQSRSKSGKSSPYRPLPTMLPTSQPTSQPTNKPTNRPPSGGGNSFDNGLRAGRRAANKIWRNAGSTCAAAWGDFQNRVDSKIRSEKWNRTKTGNWRVNSFNQGARDGMKEIVTQKEKECFRDSADECVDLGDEAARIIAYNHCGGGGIFGGKNWRRECRNAAIDQCKAQIRNETRNACGSSPSKGDRKALQNRCKGQVKKMIGDGSEEE